jgi:hypothetical protein
MYLRGESLTNISKILKIDRKKLSKLLKQDNIAIRYNNQKHIYNEAFFEKIDTEEKAYWLGFMYADGYVDDFSKYEFSLSLKMSDEEHVEKFARTIVVGEPHIARERNTALNGIVFQSCRFSVANKKMVLDLINLGCLPNKSLILTFPSTKIVPKHLQRYFIRGHFDGDGCVTYGLKPYKHIGMKINSTENFLASVQDVFKKNVPNYTCVKLFYMARDNVYLLCKGGTNAVRSLFEYLYKDATIYLPRKYQKFIDYYNL